MNKAEIIYALPNEQISFFVEFEENITAKQAIEKSGILDKYPELKLENLKLGVYSEIVDLNAELKHKDRLEIYRELTIDPKQARMIRAEQKRKREGIKLFGA